VIAVHVKHGDEDGCQPSGIVEHHGLQPSIAVGQRAVFRRVGRQFVHGNAHGVGGLGGQRHRLADDCDRFAVAGRS